MTRFDDKPRVFGRRLAREMTPDEISLVSGGHGGCQGTADTGFTTPDMCCDGVLTGGICGDLSSGSDFGDGNP